MKPKYRLKSALIRLLKYECQSCQPFHRYTCVYLQKMLETQGGRDAHEVSFKHIVSKSQYERSGLDSPGKHPNAAMKLNLDRIACYQCWESRPEDPGPISQLALHTFVYGSQARDGGQHFEVSTTTLLAIWYQYLLKLMKDCYSIMRVHVSITGERRSRSITRIVCGTHPRHFSNVAYVTTGTRLPAVGHRKGYRLIWPSCLVVQNPVVHRHVGSPFLAGELESAETWSSLEHGIPVRAHPAWRDVSGT